MHDVLIAPRIDLILPQTSVIVFGLLLEHGARQRL